MYVLAYAIGYFIGKNFSYTRNVVLSDANIQRVIDRWTDVYSD